MVIINGSTNQSLKNVTILLKREEIIQMIGYLDLLLKSKTQADHYHLNNESYSKEITLATYDINGNLNIFADDYQKLILNDS